PVISAFRTAAPGVTLTIAQPEEIEVVRELVRSGECEIGVLDQRAQDTDELRMEVIATQELFAVLPPGTRVGRNRTLTWPDLLAHGLITGARGTLVRDLVEQWAREEGREVRVAIELGRRETSIHLVLVGAGAAVLPASLAQTAAALGAEVRPLRHPVPRTLCMCWRPGPLSPAAELFRRLVRARVATAAGAGGAGG
ncbi:LysR family transcriptional regulator substrate-binding protein, partial [Intrasporangium sp.]|uniref:LysR family transcriptional regulator substrate-binding protein n=1 Tax=Intrasporangium sp. TaxID=1925024 RepID=UPI0032217DF3